MKTSRILLIAFAAATFFFTSCEQDTFEQTIGAETTTQETEQLTQSEIEGIAPAEEGPQHPMENTEEFQKEVAQNLPSIDTTKELITLSPEAAVTSRSSYDLTVYNGLASIACSNVKYGTVYGHSNKVHNGVYNHFGLNANLNGGDYIYLINVTQPSVVEFDLDNTTQNLAMVLFETDVALATTFTLLQLQDVKAYSTSSSTHGDNVGPVQLQPGYYALVIDSRYGYPSNFKLSVNCHIVDPGCVPSTHTLVSDDFKGYSTGNISHQSYRWDKWNAGAYYDGEVVWNANYSDKLLKVERKSTSSAHQPDVLWKFGTRSWGHYVINMKMWVYNYNSAYFNIQKNLTYNNSNNEFGGQVYFYSNGTGKVYIGGQNYHFSYGQNKWMDIRIDVNFYTNQTRLIIDGHTKATWPCTWWAHGQYGSSQIEAIDFYPYANNSKFYISGICLSKY